MGIILKHSWKNILSKPLRLIVLVVCIAMACFAALLAFDMSNNVVSILRGYTAQMLGNINVYVIGAEESDIKGVEEVADLSYVGVGVRSVYEYSHDETDYNYINTDTYKLFSFTSLETAVDMRILSSDLEIDDNSAVASPSFAEKFDKKVGDTVVLDTADGNEIELVISGIYDVDSQYLSKDALLISENVMRQINCTEENTHAIWFFCVKDESKISDVTSFLKHSAPKARTTDLYEIEDTSLIDDYTHLFYLVFLVTILLVAFVSMSMSEKIVNERMSVIGTLRSLGVRSRKTTFILLLENALYAIIGACIGMLLYGVFKAPLLSSILFFTDNDGNPLDLTRYYLKTPVYLYLAVLAVAILLECAYPMYELLKAVKTPIRDIIFNNKDTEFKYTWRRLYIGGGLAVVSIVTAFMVKSFTIVGISIASGVIALAVLLPYIVRFLSRGMARLFTKMPVAQLAAENISRNKSLMGNSILAVISMLLSLLVIAVCIPVWKWLAPSDFLYDVVVDVTYIDGVDYSYLGNIQGYKDMDIVYDCGRLATVALAGSEPEGDSFYLRMAADTPHTLSNSLPREVYGLAEDETVISENIADKYGFKTGDVITVTMHPDTDFPIELVLKVVDIYDPYEISGNMVPDNTNVVIVNKDLYDRYFLGYVNEILFTTDDPEGLKKEIGSCSSMYDVEVKTASELSEESQDEAKGLASVLSAVVVGSVVLTLIGVAGNQTFAFITRKREIALIYSVVMGRRKLRKLLFLESLFSIGLSALIAVVATPIFYLDASHLMMTFSSDHVDILRPELIDIGPIAVLVVLILVVYVLTVIAPIKSLNKMKISEELKYE